MVRPVSIRQRLLRELVIGILLLAAGILATTFVGSRRAIATLADDDRTILIINPQ